MAMSKSFAFSLALIPVVILWHLWLSPYTKVEESFNVQATHDIITYGVPTTDVRAKFEVLYDHMTFPGAVPRTFIGAICLAGVAKPVLWLLELGRRFPGFAVAEDSGLTSQLVGRFVDALKKHCIEK